MLDVLSWRTHELRVADAMVALVLAVGINEQRAINIRVAELECVAISSGFPGLGGAFRGQLMDRRAPNGGWHASLSQMCGGSDWLRVTLVLVERGLAVQDEVRARNDVQQAKLQRRFDAIADAVGCDLGYAQLHEWYQGELERLARAKLSAREKAIHRGRAFAEGAALGLVSGVPSAGKLAGRWARQRVDKIATVDDLVRELATTTLSMTFLMDDRERRFPAAFCRVEDRLNALLVSCAHEDRTHRSQTSDPVIDVEREQRTRVIEAARARLHEIREW